MNKIKSTGRKTICRLCSSIISREFNDLLFFCPKCGADRLSFQQESPDSSANSERLPSFQPVNRFPPFLIVFLAVVLLMVCFSAVLLLFIVI